MVKLTQGLGITLFCALGFVALWGTLELVKLAGFSVMNKFVVGSAVLVWGCGALIFFLIIATPEDHLWSNARKAKAMKPHEKPPFVSAHDMQIAQTLGWFGGRRQYFFGYMVGVVAGLLVQVLPIQGLLTWI